MRSSHSSTRALVEGAVMIALATVLGYIRFYRFPAGGSVDLALIPILVYCLRWGPKWSLLVCFTNGVLQFFLGGGLAISWQSMILDYVLAYTLIFLCGFASGKPWGWLWGTILGTVGRWASMTLAGALLWYEYMPETFLGMAMVDPWQYSALYNGLVAGLTMVLDLVVLGIFWAVPTLREHILEPRND